ncbi:hypothetical protein TcarDRAFT_1297, partial [Thermosinus carboxydivorans Nor1]
ETFQKAAEVRRQNKVTAKRNTKFEYLLSGIIKCPKCGYAMRGTRFPKRNNKDYAYYVCSAYVNAYECDNRRCVPSQELDEAVWQEIVNMFKKSGGIRRDRNKTSDAGKEKARAEARLKKLKARQAAILKWVTDGTIDLEVAEKELQKLNSDINAAQAILSAPEPAAKESDVSPTEVFEANTFEERRRIILRLGITVTAERSENGETLYKIRF